VPRMGHLRCEAPMIVGIRSSSRESRSINVSPNRGPTYQAAFTMVDSYRAAPLFRSDVIANSIRPQRDRLLLRPCSRLPLRRPSGARQAESAGALEPSIETWAQQPRISRLHQAEIKCLPDLHIVPNVTIVRLDLDFETGRARKARLWHHGVLQSIEAKTVALACGGRENARLVRGHE